MQPALLARPSVPLGRIGRDVVLAVCGTGPQTLHDAVQRIATTPELLAVVRRVVVLDAEPTAVPIEVRALPVGVLRTVRRRGAARPEAVAVLLAEALSEPEAAAVLVVDDVAVREPAVLRAACEAALGSIASDVIGLRDPGARGSGPQTWWGAVLPLDAVRAVGATLPEAGDVALADLVLRAEAAGFRPSVLAAAGPVPAVDAEGRALLALLHGPVSARGSLLGALGADLLAGLRGRGAAGRTRLWLRWPGLRRTLRAGSVARASHDAWLLRAAEAEMNSGWPEGGREASSGRPAALRLTAWWTTRRRPSAA